MAPFTRELRAYGFRVLAYIDEFLVAPSPFGTTATQGDCTAATPKIEALMSRLGIRRHEKRESVPGRVVSKIWEWWWTRENYASTWYRRRRSKSSRRRRRSFARPYETGGG